MASRRSTSTRRANRSGATSWLETLGARSLATFFRCFIRDGKRAIEVAEQTVQLSSGKDAILSRTSAAVYSEVGRFLRLLQFAQQACNPSYHAGEDRGSRIVSRKTLSCTEEQVPLRGNLSGKLVNPALEAYLASL